jgi:diphosphomevalonate decarboxylase
VRTILDPDEWPLAVVVAVTSVEEKEVPSTEGMELSARTSPFYDAWVDGSEPDLASARAAILDRDFDALAAVAEHSCLKMHAVMMASRPGLLYWNGATIRCLARIRELRRSGVGVFFTVDAGPQVKAICLSDEAPRVAEELRAIAGVESILTTGLGAGARTVGP